MKFTLKKNVLLQLIGLVSLTAPYVNLDTVQTVLPPKYQLPFQLVVGALMSCVAIIAQHKNPDGTKAEKPWVKPVK